MNEGYGERSVDSTLRRMDVEERVCRMEAEEEMEEEVEEVPEAETKRQEEERKEETEEESQ